MSKLGEPSWDSKPHSRFPSVIRQASDRVIVFRCWHVWGRMAFFVISYKSYWVKIKFKHFKQKVNDIWCQGISTNISSCWCRVSNRVCLCIFSVNVLFKSNKESKIDWQICPVGVWSVTKCSVFCITDCRITGNLEIGVTREWSGRDEIEFHLDRKFELFYW